MAMTTAAAGTTVGESALVRAAAAAADGWGARRHVYLPADATMTPAAATAAAASCPL
jgi:hypothetical protein